MWSLTSHSRGEMAALAMAIRVVVEAVVTVIGQADRITSTTWLRMLDKGELPANMPYSCLGCCCAMLSLCSERQREVCQGPCLACGTRFSISFMTRLSLYLHILQWTDA